MLLIVFELFRIYHLQYHEDYFEQLRQIIKSLPNDILLHDRRFIRSEIMSHYYSCSHNRFKFAQKFINYLDDFICNNSN